MSLLDKLKKIGVKIEDLLDCARCDEDELPDEEPMPSRNNMKREGTEGA